MAECVGGEVSDFLLAEVEDDVDDESLLISLNMIEHDLYN